MRKFRKSPKMWVGYFYVHIKKTFVAFGLLILGMNNNHIIMTLGLVLYCIVNIEYYWMIMLFLLLLFILGLYRPKKTLLLTTVNGHGGPKNLKKSKPKNREMKWINFTDFFFDIFWKYNFNFYGKYSKKKFVKLIYLIWRVFLAWTFLNFLDNCKGPKLNELI